ncbi:alpha/beta hydrolase [soil metagenome]
MSHPGWLTLAALVAALLLSACAPVATLNAIASASPGYEAETGVAYAAEPRQRLDIYRPTAKPPANGWPLVVFFYGGSWNSGSRDEYKFVGTALASRGVVTLVADYRLYPEVRYPDFLVDSAQALAWGLEHTQQLNADPKRVFVMGHSAGGYNAAMLALDSRWLKTAGHLPSELAGWIGLAGPYDFLPTDNPLAQPVFFHPNYPAHAQPIEFPSAQSPRTFLGAPEHDELVDPTRSTRSLAAKLEAAGAPVTLKIYERPSHAVLIGAFALPLRWIAPVLNDVTDFIGSAPPAR